jgi:hypothetical protein
VDTLEVTLVTAHHWKPPGLFDHCATLCGGFILTAAGGRRVHHARATAPTARPSPRSDPGTRASTSRCCRPARTRRADSCKLALEPIERTRALGTPQRGLARICGISRWGRAAHSYPPSGLRVEDGQRGTDSPPPLSRLRDARSPRGFNPAYGSSLGGWCECLPASRHPDLAAPEAPW